MKYEVYIIEKNTPESKLLTLAGLDRDKLEIVRWEGVKKINGGFGRTPVAWRVSGVENVEKLCLQIVKSLSNKSNLSTNEARALIRASKIINGIVKYREKESNSISNQRNKALYIQRYLQSHNFENIKIQKIVQEVLKNSSASVTDLRIVTNQFLELDLKAINEARRIFKMIMQ